MKKVKKNLPKIFLVVVFFFLLAGFFARRVLHIQEEQPSSFSQSAEVRAVYDGDTIKVRFESGEERIVRLIGVNTPEMEASSSQKKWEALVSKRFAFYYLYPQTVDLSYDQDKEDTYGRLLAYIWTEDQGLFNEFMVKKGFARAYLKFPFRYQESFYQAQKEAQREERGLWKERPYPSISPRQAGAHIGELITVEYECVSVEKEDQFVFLHSAEKKFSALIEEKNWDQFPDVRDYEGKKISVSGFMEEYKGNPQIIIFLPQQIS
ncbi:thermonuclease family protein [bacterium]|nr:thermonuclease family protein [bacterium]